MSDGEKGKGQSKRAKGKGQGAKVNSE